MQASARFARLLESLILLLPTTVGGAKQYLRRPFGSRLVRLNEMLTQSWEGLDVIFDSTEAPALLTSVSSWREDCMDQEPKRWRVAEAPADSLGPNFVG